MSYSYTSNQWADWAENFVKLDLVGLGWNVLDPSSRDCIYDLAVDLGRGVFTTIQVKTLRGYSLPTTTRQPGSCATFVSGGVVKQRRWCHYRDEPVGWMAGVNRQDMTIFYYPLNVYKNYDKAINVRKVDPIPFPKNETVKGNNDQVNDLVVEDVDDDSPLPVDDGPNLFT